MKGHAGKSQLTVPEKLFVRDSSHLLNHIPDLLLITDLKGKIRETNFPVHSNFPDHKPGTKAGALIDQRYREMEETLREKVIRTSKPAVFVYSGIYPDTWFSASLSRLGKDELIYVISNITECKHAEREELAEKEFVTGLFESVQAFVLVLDNKGRISRINPFMEETTGFSLQDVKQKDWLTVFNTPENRALSRQKFKDILKGIPISRYVAPILTKEGKKLDVEWYAKHLKDKSEAILGVLFFGQLISDRLTIEEALKDSEVKLELITRTAKLASWELDLKTHCFTFNDQFYHLFRTTAEAMGGYEMPIGTYLEKMVHPDDRQLILNEIEASRYVPNLPEKFEIQHRIKFPDGDTGYVLARILLVKDKDNRPVRIIGANQDITDMVLAEDALRKSEAHLSNAVEIARLGYWEYDVALNQFLFNDQFYSIFKTTAEQEGGYRLTPKQYADRFLHPEDRWLVEKETKAALETADPEYSREISHRIIYKDGTEGTILVRFFIEKDEFGKTIRTYGANQDITKRVRIEQKLTEQNKEHMALNQELKQTIREVKRVNKALEEARKKAEESDKLKSAFLANMSHEIRTPMNGIIGFSKLISRPNLSNERKQQYAEIINDMCRQLLHIIDDIIDISKIETGQININLSETNINDILMRLFSFYNSTAAKNNVRLFLNKALPDDRAVVCTDHTKLRQVLDNLLSNSLKFTTEGFVKFGYTCEDRAIRFFVSDSGTGIPKSLQGSIFERFRQAENNISNLQGGTGLGLSISKAFIEKLGGKIWLESAEGSGSTFYFTLPLGSGQKPGDTGTTEQLSAQKSRPKILVVEDEEVNYLYLEEVLINLDISILHAKTGGEAIELFKCNPDIRLVLLDIKLPDISGNIVFESLRKINPSVQAIAQTAYALTGDKEKVLAAGFSDYLAKPIDAAELIEKVSFFIGKR
ncbi:MAG: PAS domain S-box protein [Bacteroidales bacterium]|nr:PAS domain S-box protein [Bacteroidales bacterium]